MRNIKMFTKIILGVISGAIISGCSSDDKDELPTVSVLSSVQVKEKRTVSIEANAKDDNSGLTYSWSKVSGADVQLSSTSAASIQVTAPAVEQDSTAVLRVTVKDSAGQSASADINVNIANNRLPSVTASFSPINEKAVGELMVTAADPDGTVGSYLWTQMSGPAVTATGTTTAKISFTAPGITSDTPIQFRITVADDDNDSITIEQAVTIKQLVNNYTISGTMAEEVFDNGTLTGILAGQSFTTSIAESGSFNLVMTADDDETNLFSTVSAKSTTNANIELKTFVPSLEKTPASAVGSTPAKTAASVQPMQGSNSNQVSINALSTALYSLIVQANGGEVPADLDDFTLVEKSVSPDELIEAAAIVKLIAAGGEFDLPAGVTLIELLTDNTAYNEFVAAVNDSNPGIIQATINEIIADPTLTPPIDDTSVASMYFEVYPAADGFLSRGGNRIDFDRDGTGRELDDRNVNEFTWTVKDGLIHLTWDEDVGFSSFPTARAGVAGLTQQQVDLLAQNGISQVHVIRKPISSTLQRIVAGQRTDTFRWVSKAKETLVPIILPNSTVISTNGVIAEGVTSDQLLRNGDKLDSLKFDSADMAGKWFFERYYYAGDKGRGFSGIFADILDVKANGTGIALENDVPFTWSLNEHGMFIVNLEDGTRLESIKIDQAGTDYQVFSTIYDAAGKPIAADSDYGMKVETADFSTTSFVNGTDRYWQTTINQWTKAAWNGDVLRWDDGFAFFGFKFNDDGSGLRLQSYTSAPPNFVPNLNSPLSWTLDKNNSGESILNINRRPCWDNIAVSCDRRLWRLLKTTEGVIGKRIYVMEVNYYRDSSQEAESLFIGPRLNMYEDFSFGYWNDNYEQIKQAPSSVQSYTLKQIAKVPRLLIEPNQTTARHQ